ncbi:MAG: PqqD family protein [Endomicrobia bacterium]|nr:PqqD family protein [Endomicrobiia bacterium]
MIKKYKLKQNIAYRKIGENVYIVDSKNSMLYKLNETASLIWEGISKGESISKIIKKILSEYEIDYQTVKSDVEELIDQLKDKSLIE